MKELGDNKEHASPRCLPQCSFPYRTAQRDPFEGAVRLDLSLGQGVVIVHLDLGRIILTKILRKDLDTRQLTCLCSGRGNLPVPPLSSKSRPEEEQMAEGPPGHSEGRRVSKLLDQQILQLQEMCFGCRAQGLMINVTRFSLS